MIHKYGDLVVIPKKWLKNVLYKEFGKPVISVEKQAKPLLPIVENAFKRGLYIASNDFKKDREDMQDFINKGIDL